MKREKSGRLQDKELKYTLNILVESISWGENMFISRNLFQEKEIPKKKTDCTQQ